MKLSYSFSSEILQKTEFYVGGRTFVQTFSSPLTSGAAAAFADSLSHLFPVRCICCKFFENSC